MIQLQQIRQGFALPKHELSKFDGNPLEFWNFIRTFESNIERNASDESEKLTFLLQYCSGAARNAIKSCVSMDPLLGYQTAKALLEDRFGNPFKVATAYLNEVTNGPPVRPHDSKALLAFADKLRDCTNGLESIGYLEEINSADNLRRIVNRLPFHLKMKWLEVADSIQQSGQRPKIHDISRFVTTKARVANNPVFGASLNEEKERSNPRVRYPSTATKMTTLATQGSSRKLEPSTPRNERAREEQRPPIKDKTLTSTPRKCLVCNGMHQLWNCEQFKRKSYGDRIKIMRDAKLCENCFTVGHMTKGCVLRSGCYVEGCNMKHMTVLHPPSPPSPSQAAHHYAVNPSGSDNFRSDIIAAQNHVIGAGEHDLKSHSTNKVRLKIVPVRVRGKLPDKVVETYALLDNGSDVTLCDRKLVEQLELEGKPRNFFLTTQEMKDSPKKGLEVQLSIESIHGDSSLEVPKAWTVDHLNISESSIPKHGDVNSWPHLSDIEFPELKSKEVKLLIGCNVPEAFWVMDERRGGRGEPVAIRSLLGWTLIGPAEKVERESSFHVSFVRLEVGSEEDPLLRQVKQFWKNDFADSISSSKMSMSVEDHRALRVMEDSVQKVAGHYQVALPWRHIPPFPPNNRVAAEQRLYLLKKRFLREPEFFASYKASINDYINKGYAIQVPEEQLHPEGKPLWYLPHHAVQHAHKDKLRVVFDCAAHYRGVSLNDQLLHGPDLTNNLFGVLERFRQESVALVSDIEAMFHQVRVDPKDYDALRFLWWPDDDLSKQPIEYRMEVHLFGSTSSPSCANFSLRKTAKDQSGDFSPEVISTVLKNFYVDDCLKSVASSSVARNLRKELCELLSKGGFRLTKWLCNNKDVLDSIPRSERASSVLDLDLNAGVLPVERTLGVQWNVDTDTLTFKITARDKPPTRRGILSATSSVYDPLGLLAPFILLAKKLIQDLCKKGYDWDEHIGEDESLR